MAEFQIVNRRQKNKLRKSKINKNLTERIEILKNDLKLTDFFQKCKDIIHNALETKSHQSDIGASKDSTKSDLQAVNRQTLKNSTLHKVACSDEIKLEKAVKECQIRNENTNVNKVAKKEANSEEQCDEKFEKRSELKCENEETLQNIVCYGLGNFSDSYIAKYQLAFLLLIIEVLDIPVCRCHIFDPMFNEEEKLSLRNLGFVIIPENEAGKRKCNRRTLFYMPHCGRALYNNLIWANWGRNLDNIVIIGNSFARMVDSTPKRILEETGHFIFKIHSYVTEKELPVTEKFEDIFNDTVIHIFKGLNQISSEEFWDDISEPQYDDCDPEIIFPE